MLHIQLLNGLEIKILLQLCCCCNKQLAVSTFKTKGNTLSSSLINPKYKTGVYLATTTANKGPNYFSIQNETMDNKSLQENKLPTTSYVKEPSNMQSSNKVVKKYLAAFDFDYTVVAQNTDTVIRDLLPPDKLTKDMQDIIEVQGWTEYMAEVFRRLHSCQIRPEKILETIHGIPEVPGFVRLLKRLNTKYGCDLIVISDSNSVFIEEWIKSHGLQENFARVFTNPARFEESGLLTIKPFHHQTDCRLSAVNLCKGKVLEHFMIEQDLRYNTTYERVIYVGDGNNDICPVTKLRNRDIACAREGFAMAKTLAKNPTKLKVRAEFLTWKSGFDLLDQLERQMEKFCKQQQEKLEAQSDSSDIAQTHKTETTKVH